MTNSKNSIERALVATISSSLGGLPPFLNKCQFFTGQSAGDLTLPAVVVACNESQSTLTPGLCTYHGIVQIMAITNAHDETAAADHDSRVQLLEQLLQQIDDVVADINAGSDAHVYGYYVTQTQRATEGHDIADTITIEVDYQPISQP